MFVGILTGIIIPIIFLKTILLLQRKPKKPKTNAIVLSVTVILFALNGVFCFIYSDLFALAGFYSHTENVSDYGVYEDVVEEIVINYDLDDFLPNKVLVEKYGNYNYSYEYFVYREHVFVIQTEIQFPDNSAFEKEKNRLLSINSPTQTIFDNVYCDYYVWSDDIEKPWEASGHKYLKTAIFDNDKKTIKYIIENNIYEDSLLLDYLNQSGEKPIRGRFETTDFVLRTHCVSAVPYP